HRKGVVIVTKAGAVTEDDGLAAVLDAGAEDVEDLGDSLEVTSEPGDLDAVRAAVEGAGLGYDSAEVAFLPVVEVPLDEDQAKRVFRLIEALEDSDDLQDVYANYSVSDEVMEKLEYRARANPGALAALRGRGGPRGAPGPAGPRPSRRSRWGRPVSGGFQGGRPPGPATATRRMR